MRNSGLLAIVVVALVLIGVDVFVQSRHDAPVTKVSSVAADERAPDGVRVRVQVLNATKVHGLARHATTVLRDRGFDVVETGTSATTRDTTVIYDLSGHPDWAKRIARAFMPSRVETRTDSSRYLDIAVVIGTTWRPPAEPFYP
jgi:LytR cell envelope-related transcriptional attenuator